MIILFLLVVSLLILVFLPEPKDTVVDTQVTYLPIYDTVEEVDVVVPQAIEVSDMLDEPTSISGSSLPERNYRIPRPVNEEPSLPSTKLRGKVLHSKFCRHLDEKRLGVIRKYGVTKGHKRPYRFDRQDQRSFKQSQHDYLYLNIENDGDIVELCDLDDTLTKIWG